MKPAHFLRFCAVLPGLAMLAACGGGGGGGGSATIPVAQATPTTAPMGPLVSIPIHGASPSTVAYQSGMSGKWTVVTPSNGVVSFNLAVGVTAYSVAAACPLNTIGGFNTSPSELVIQATTADAPSINCRIYIPGTVNATLFMEDTIFPNTDSFSATQVSAGPSGLYSSGFSNANGNGDQVGSPLWYAGSSDIVARVLNAGVTVGAHITRGVTFTPNETLTLDPLAISDEVAPPTVVAVPAGMNSLAWWVLADGGYLFLGSATGNANVPVIPATSAVAGDYYEVAADGNVGGQFATSVAAASSPSTLAPVMPTAPLTIPVPPAADLASANLAYNGFTVTGTRYYNFALYYVSAVRPVAPGAPLITITASQSYLGTGTTVTMPDLSSVSGMITAPTAGTAVNLIGADYVASGAISWDNLTANNAYFAAPLPVNAQFQSIQSQYTINYTAP